jgi:serine-type D-Ala-D-Ala carboxypeptidase/endopeptidase (penicillin-binding protein 4)
MQGPHSRSEGALSARFRGLATLVLPTLFALFALGCTTGRVRPGWMQDGAPLADLRRSIDSMIAAPQFRNAHWGILIVDPQSGDTLYSHNAGKLFMPASNMKIVTGAVALATLGPDFRFRTTFVARGPVRDGTLAGDLIVQGRGDPTVSDAMRGDALAPLREIADSLTARGITRIAGHILPGDDAFPDATLGFGWSWDDLGSSYGSGVDELFLNDGFARIAVRGGARVGDSVTAVALPTREYPVVHVLAATGWPPDTAAATGALPHEALPSSALTALVDSATGAISVIGFIAPNSSDTLEVVFPNQRAAYLAGLREALASRGIVVDEAPSATIARAPAVALVPGGGQSANHGSAYSPPLDTLFAFDSPPLRDILRAMEKPSQNQIAEILLKTIALERTHVGSADSGRRVVENQLLSWGADSSGFVIRDGSGLSRYNYLSPETIVRTLAAIRQDTAFSVFYNALPIAGVDGTIKLRMRGTPAQGNVHAKTGFIANARSLSGYVTTADGRVLVFSALCNNWTVPVADVERVQDVIAARLAGFTLRGRH